MIRKEDNTGDERRVCYIIEDGEANVCKIISELSSLGCKGAELGKAYDRLVSADKCYTYENPQTKDKLLVIDERSFERHGDGNPFMPLMWAFLMARMSDANPCRWLIQELKKGGEEVL